MPRSISGLIAGSLAVLTTLVVSIVPAHASFELPAIPQQLTIAPSKQSPIAVVWIERLGVKASVFEGVTDTQFRRGLGHWPGTAMPGTTGNVVLGGHRVTWPNLFRHIDTLQIGDSILVRYRTRLYTYVVTNRKIVKPTAVGILSQRVSRPTLTLFSCHPPGTYQKRYVVTAVLKR